MIRIEIYSDIVCPFCYIGKRNLEAALERYEHRAEVRLEWKSFELDPEAERDPKEGLGELLARKYGRSLEWARQMHDQMTEQAKTVGLEFRFDLARPTNTFDAHRLIHLAKKHGRQDAAEERLFQAYYTRGEHVGDPVTLQRIGEELGLDSKEVGAALASDAFVRDVRRDEEDARSNGISAVPFFVFNRKYAVSGAQPIEVFERALRAAREDAEPRLPESGAPKNGVEEACGPNGCEPA